MSDMTKIIVALVFVSIWYALTLIGRALFKPYERMKLVWCPEVRGFSCVQLGPVSGSAPEPVSVQRCLLWPEYKGCKERCVKSGRRTRSKTR
jgi:hypothetical protein